MDICDSCNEESVDGLTETPAGKLCADCYEAVYVEGEGDGYAGYNRMADKCEETGIMVEFCECDNCSVDQAYRY